MLRSNRSRIALALATAALLAAGCGDGGAGTDAPAGPQTGEAAALAQQARDVFGMLPDAPVAADATARARVDLGRALYYDPRLSKGQEISCNSCHLLDKFGQDGLPTSPGHQGQLGDRNSPTTFNAALHVAQFWDGRAADVEEQATGPVMNPVEMAMVSEDQVVVVLGSMPGYVEMFAAAFPGEEQPISLANAGVAIGAFERGLVTPGPFDDFMAGDLDALSAQQQQGLRTFIATGCITCHNGATVGGTMFQKLGLVKPYETEDTGRFKVTGKEADRYVFKVPSLRNVAETGPWFHDGSIASLDEMVRIMGRHQLGRELQDGEVRDIVAFLGSLTGTVDAQYVAAPELPESSDATPAPDPS